MRKNAIFIKKFIFLIIKNEAEKKITRSETSPKAKSEIKSISKIPKK
jgi:hypothetical protein